MSKFKMGRLGGIPRRRMMGRQTSARRATRQWELGPCAAPLMLPCAKLKPVGAAEIMGRGKERCDNPSCAQDTAVQDR
jgi:hypothetical protein